jgi:hypothetical protein
MYLEQKPGQAWGGLGLVGIGSGAIFHDMSAPEKPSLSGLSRGDLEALTERLLSENAALKQATADLRAEIAALKGVKGRSAIQPIGMERTLCRCRAQCRCGDRAHSARPPYPGDCWKREDGLVARQRLQRRSLHRGPICALEAGHR